MKSPRKKLKILFLLQDVPYPLSNGMRSKVFYLLQYLSAKHQCDVISYVSPNQPDALNSLRDQLPYVNWLKLVPQVGSLHRKIRAVFNLLSGQPVSFARYQSRAFEMAFHSALAEEDYDVIHYDIVNMAAYYVAHIPSVHSPNDATSLLYQCMVSSSAGVFAKAKLKLAQVLIQNYEKKNYSNFTKIHVVSACDMDYFKKLVPDATVVCIPFGVSAAKCKDSIKAAVRIDSAPSVLVLGGANVPSVAAGIEQFVRLCAPKLLKQIPELKVKIQGRGTIELILQMGVDIDKRIEVSNWVESLDDLINTSSIVVLPDLSGTGIKTRALQAMACGAAVVGTSVAFAGIKEFVQKDKHCIIVDSDSGFVEEIIRLLANENYRLEMGNSAKALIYEKLSWDRLGPLYEKLYQDAANTNNTTSPFTSSFYSRHME